MPGTDNSNRKICRSSAQEEKQCQELTTITERSVEAPPKIKAMPGSDNNNRKICRSVGRLCGLAVRHSLRDREVRGSIPGRVKPRTLKLVLAADPPSVWHYGFSAKSDWPGVRIINTHTELGLKFIRDNAFLKSHGDRDRVANILIVVTDGQSTEPALTKVEAEAIHKENINIFAIGVGSGVDRSELELIASSPNNVFTVSNFQALDNIQANLQKTACAGGY
ncbi:collagen alpha-5(VI) chain [Elysia marginata]|uniref:Collagen alpha-5(VI) chain n=1 Tax=Elysia marginata TaxID=1093978 RepID=A0AAV4HDA0_9GAST|nr:collagen alpha-5(VI) chain [Elysia marginata]